MFYALIITLRNWTYDNRCFELFRALICFCSDIPFRYSFASGNIFLRKSNSSLFNFCSIVRSLKWVVLNRQPELNQFNAGMLQSTVQIPDSCRYS